MTALDRLVEQGFLARDVMLGSLTTYKLGGPAKYLLNASSEDDLAAVAGVLEPETATLVVGRGSNLVVSDSGFDGIVVHLAGSFASIEIGKEAKAGGAASLPLLARTAVRQGRLGLEWCVGVPGSVGGAVRMNAGCHGEETSDWLASARVVDLYSGSAVDRAVDDLDLQYRSSSLADHEVVVAAAFRTTGGDPAEGEARIRQITRWRRLNQPGGTLNAGSVFKNPPGDAAGRLIDHSGLKEFRVGGVAVSAKHANFFVADDGAKAQDLYDLVWSVRRRVGEETGVWLEPEVRFAGAFTESVDASAGP